MGNNKGFSDGFLLGLLIGGAAVFLLGTKKGNKILQAFTEEGLEGLTDFIDSLDEEKIAKNTVKKTEKIAAEVAPVLEEKVEDKIEEKLADVPKSNGVNHAASSTSRPKRFFKRK
jgi:hypothetical protein